MEEQKEATALAGDTVATESSGDKCTPNTGHETAKDIWGDAGVIANQLANVPTLPDEVLPDPYRKWIVDVAHRMQTPTDFAAISAVVVASSVIGSSCAIKPKQKDDWSVVPNLWGACVGRPSIVLKSPSMKEAMNMLVKLQTAARDVYDDEMRVYEFERKLEAAKEKAAKQELEKLVKSKTVPSKKAASKKSDGAKSDSPPVSSAAAIDQLRADFLNGSEVEEPTRKLYKTNETSIQSQTVLQNENERGVLTFRDELTGLVSRWDLPEHADERAYFLEGWNGDAGYTDFKIGRGLTEADNVCISLLGGIQPDKLWRYLHQSMNGGNDGMIQRFQLLVYPDEPKAWRLVDEDPDEEARDRAFKALDTLDTLDYTHIGKKEESDRVPFLRFTPAAQEYANKWFTELKERTLSEDNPVMCEHMGKYWSLMPSLALIFHLLSVAEGKANGDVSEHAAIMACGWCEYLEKHARRIYGYVHSPARSAAVVLSKHVDDLPNPFTARDVYRNHWHLLGDREKVESACAVLIDENWLTVSEADSSGGRPPLPQYSINPNTLKEK